jgi:hypothetical protein
MEVWKKLGEQDAHEFDAGSAVADVRESKKPEGTSLCEGDNEMRRARQATSS